MFFHVQYMEVHFARNLGWYKLHVLVILIRLLFGVGTMRIGIMCYGNQKIHR
jgi:hypothetical protein